MIIGDKQVKLLILVVPNVKGYPVWFVENNTVLAVLYSWPQYYTVWQKKQKQAFNFIAGKRRNLLKISEWLISNWKFTFTCNSIVIDNIDYYTFIL